MKSVWFLLGGPEDIADIARFDLWQREFGYSCSAFGENLGDGYGNGENEESSEPSGAGFGDGDL